MSAFAWLAVFATTVFAPSAPAQGTAPAQTPTQPTAQSAPYDLLVVLPDVRGAVAAYGPAPLVQTLRSEPAAQIQEFAAGLGWNLAEIFSGLLPTPDPNRPEDPLWPWSACTRAAISVSGLEEAEPSTAVATWGVLEFADAAAAEQAERALLAGQAEPAAAHEPLTIDGQPVPVSTYDLPFDWIGKQGWILRHGTRLVIGAGKAAPADHAAHVAQLTAAPAASSAEETAAFGAPAGPIVLELYADLERMPFSTGNAVGDASISILFPFLSAKGVWRIELAGDRFVTTAIYTPTGTALALDGALGRAPLAAKAAELVPPESVGTWLTSIDATRAEDGAFALLAPSSGARLAPPAEGAPRLGDGLGRSCAISLLPVQSLMSLQGGENPARVLCTLELVDAARFEAGLAAWIERAKTALPELQVDRRPYRKISTITLHADAAANGSPAGEPSALEFAAVAADKLTLAVLDDRVVLGNSAAVVRNEIKRLQEKAEAAAGAHAVAAQPGRPTDAFEASHMDWATLIGKLYDSARGFAPMLAQGGPAIDVEKLPTGAALFAAFRPTTGWSRRLGARIHSRHESSFGPETPLGVAAMGLLADRIFSARGAAMLGSTPVEPKPAEPVASAEREATLSALREVRTGIAVFRAQSGALPASLEALLNGTPDFPDGFLPGGKLPPDGWGRALVYRLTQDKSDYALRSTGADGIDQDGAGDDVALP